MRVFIDTEFTDLFKPVLISMGLVAENGTECYIEVNEGWTQADCSDFTHAVVLPLLQGGDVRMPARAAARRVFDWLSAAGPDIEIVSDSHFDLRLLGQLLGEVGRGPANVTNASVITLSVEQQMKSEDAFAGGLRRHHALDDARALMVGATNV